MPIVNKVLFNFINTKAFKLMVDWYLKLKLRSKFILSFFLLVLIPFSAFGVITYQTSERAIRNNVSSLAQKNVTRISTNIDYYLSDIQSVTNILVTNQGLQNYYHSLLSLPAGSPFSSYEALSVSNDNYKIVSNIITQRIEKLSGIYFIGKSSAYLFHPRYSYLISKNTFSNDFWYKETIRSIGEKPVISLTQSILKRPGKETRVISISRVLRSAAGNEIFGVLRVDLDYDSFSDMIAGSYDSSYQKSILLVLDKDNPIYSNSPDYLSGKLSFLNKIKNDTGTIIDNIQGEEMYISYSSSPYSSWKVVSVIPSKEVLKDLIFIKYLILTATIVCIFIILFFSSLISSILLKPINKITTAMTELENGNLEARVSIKNLDETRYMADSFNKMASNIGNLLDKVYRAELRQKDAEILSLQSQINPHFLYNTLESIRGAAITYKVQSIALMSKSLSQIFRYSISKENIVPLKDELKHLQNYLSIQNFRHDNKFEIKFNIPDELYKYSIIKLSLQPIIENCIRHGLEMALGKGLIEVSASFVEGILKISVSDNGSGISRQKLLDLNHALLESNEDSNSDSSNYASGGIGLRNVNSRLKLHFGKEYGLRFLETDIGTKVELTCPAIEWKEVSV